MSTRRRTAYVCDNPACRNERLALEEDDDGTVLEAAEGFHIPAVGNITPRGGNSAVNIFACEEDCLQPAIINALKEAMG